MDNQANRCRFCLKQYVRLGCLKNHEIKCTKCSKCNINFKNRIELEKHLIESHKFNASNSIIAFNPSTTNLLNHTLSNCNVTICSDEPQLTDTDKRCDTYLRSELNLTFKNNLLSSLSSYKGKFSIALLNINGLTNKFEDIQFVLIEQIVDIFIINETKLDSNDDESRFLSAYYNTFRRDRDVITRGGGLIVYIKKSIPISNVSINTSCESISLQFKVEDQLFGLIACYRPPHYDNESSFFESLAKSIDQFESSVVDTFVVGDLNFDLFCPIKSKRLLDFTNTYGLFNTIKQGTRPNKNTCHVSLLDVILCFNLINLMKSIVLPYSDSDHHFTISIFNFKSSKPVSNLIRSRCLNPKKLDLIKIRLSVYFRFLEFTDITQAEVLWNVIKSGILLCLNEIAPYKSFNTNKLSKVPWFDDELKRNRTKRDKLYHQFIKSKNENDKSSYRKARNKYRSLARRKRTTYFSNLVNTYATSCTRLWKKLNPYINPNKKTAINHCLLASNNPHFTLQDAVNAFSNYFSSILNNVVFCQAQKCIDYIEQHLSSHTALVEKLNNSSFSFVDLEISRVEHALSTLDAESSPGYVGIEARVLKHCHVELAPIITKLFNLCLKTGELPSEWKIAFITPIPKPKTDKSQISNYRPISTLAPIAKVFESLIARQIECYFENNGLLDNNQFGFRHKKSCELALNTMVDYWRRCLNEDEKTIAIFLDLSKAFDCINHQLLLHKLKFYKFSDAAISILRNYLDERYNIVKQNEFVSKKEVMKVGVPQGSILGPLLFYNIY